eukprot:m.123247 g.123247  ORF g.123247 m.123247 type:complete len:224 (+) comp23381_c0_seq6:530-1201(+)
MRIRLLRTGRSNAEGFLTLLQVSFAGDGIKTILQRLRECGHPVVGDPNLKQSQESFHPKSDEERGFKQRQKLAHKRVRCKGVMLSLVQVEFPHPKTGIPTCVSAPWPSKFLTVMDREQRFFEQRQNSAGQSAMPSSIVEDMPTAYATGHTYFCSLRFAATPAAMIPRPSTELLVQQAVQHLLKIARDNNGSDNSDNNTNNDSDNNSDDNATTAPTPSHQYFTL